MLNKPDIDVKKYLPYVSNVKALAGVGIVLFSLYTGCSEVPGKWGVFDASRKHKDELLQNKNSLRAEEIKLNKISKELDKNPIRLVLVPQGAAPDLTLIKIAQKVIDLSESTGNTYVTLQPGVNSSVDVGSLVTLPINIPGTDASGQPAPGAPGAAPAPGGMPQAANAAPAAGSGTAINWGSGALGVFPYSLTILGSYPTLSKFVQELSKMPEFLIINSISLDPGSTSGHAGSDEIAMRMDFSVPWKPGVPPPEQGQSIKPPAEDESAEGKDGEKAPADGKAPEAAKPDADKKPADTKEKAAAPTPADTAKAKPSSEKVADKAKVVKAEEKPAKSAKVVSPAENGRPAKRKAG